METRMEMVLLVVVGGVIALGLFTFQSLVRSLFHRLGGSDAQALRLAALLQQTAKVLLSIGFPAAFLWLAVGGLWESSTVAQYGVYLVGALFLSTAVVVGLMVVMLWLLVADKSPPDDAAP